MRNVLLSFKPLAFPFIHSAFPRIQRARPKSRFAGARFAPTACPQAGASAERSAEAKPALAPAAPPRTARQGAVTSRDPGTPPSGGSLRRQPMQGAVSSPRRYPNQPLLGPTWHKWLKAAAWTLAFLQPPSEPVWKLRGALFAGKRPDGEARRRRRCARPPRSNFESIREQGEARRHFPRKPSGRRVFCPWPALTRSLQPAAGMLGTRRLGHSQNPSPKRPS